MAKVEEKEEECGIVAVISKNKKPVAPLVYLGMIGVQHRGQDAAGMVLYGGSFYEKRGFGLVLDVIGEKDLEQPHWIGIAHTRYPTTGTATLNDIQPSTSELLSVGDNAHIANYDQLRKEMEEKGYVFQGTVESELIIYMIMDVLKNGGTLREAILQIFKKLDGAYSGVGIYDGKLFIFRDPHAIRPLVYGENEDYVMFCSESCSLDINGINYCGSVLPGELIIVDDGGNMSREVLMDRGAKHCMFEYVYFSRPDSIINGKLVEHVRKELGRQVAREAPVEADLVIPVPDTSRSAALGYAAETGTEYTEGIIKNRYIGRTFIMPDPESRKRAVRMKLNPIKEVLEGKRVVLFDDSIVRGTTIKEIIKLVRACNPKKIHLRITCPPVISPCFYGVNMPTYKELIANRMGIEEIRKYLGVDSLHYISVGGLKKVIGNNGCFGCVTGEYVTSEAQKLADEKRASEGVQK